MDMRVACAAAAFAATAAFGAIPPAYWKHLPPERQQGEVAWVSGGLTPEEAASVKRAAQEYPLELVFEEKGPQGEATGLAGMPVRIRDASGRLVFEGTSNGPIFLARLAPGRYTVETEWSAWTFSRPVVIGGERERVVFSWKRAAGNLG